MDINKFILGANKAVVKTKVIDKTTVEGVVFYNSKKDEFKILYNKNSYNVQAYDFDRFSTLYSKPTNKKIDAWTKKIDKHIKPEYQSRVSMYWSTLKPNQKVRGNIINGEFIIKKIK